MSGMSSLRAVVSECGTGHRKACVDIGVDGLALGFEIEGGGGFLDGGAAVSAVGAHGGLKWHGGGIFGAEVGDFEEGVEAGAEGFGVFAGALDGFANGLGAGVAVGG